ncbi:protein kinase, partial [Helicosporidium sp. ATCC 50920]
MEEPIRESPYEPGVYFVAAEPGTTKQSIGSQQWKVGRRYDLRRVVGYGSFSAVCQAQDRDSGESVAVKRIGDVLQSPEQAKRVLRELCILRRLRHPHIISLRDAFLRPAATGPRRLVGGKVVALSVDAYLVQEFAEEGDLFSLRGQLSAEEVCELMWQLLQGVSYMHGMHVWHRDLKSQNIFVTRDAVSGQRILRIGDFGSARSASDGGFSERSAAEGGGKRARSAAAEAAGEGDGEGGGSRFEGAADSTARAASPSGRRSPPPRPVHASDSFACLGAAARVEDLYAQ